REVNIEVVPFKMAGSDKSLLLVIFDETTKGTRPERLLQALGKTAAQHEMSDMRRELSASQSAGQEMLSRNEELQLINEELETAKEELQSTNEELTTLNEELQCRNVELSLVNIDVQNLLASVDTPIVMLGRDLKIRRFTRPAEVLFRMI